VCIREHYFALKTFAAVREAFSIAYLDGEVLNKKTILMPYVNLQTLFQFVLRFKWHTLYKEIQHKAQYK
jgi:hypothetical protein